MKKFTSIAFCVGLLFSLSAVSFAQKKVNKKPANVETAAPAPVQTPPSNVDLTPAGPANTSPPKRNTRPGAVAEPGQIAVGTPNYFYEFERPGFAYGRILIEHDTNGKGKISFLKEGFTDLITDPIDLSPVTLAKLNEAFDGLKFLESRENYQHERDFTNMGNVTITLKRDGLERTVKYNWTDNKLAKQLMDEYRRISNEYTWRFEILMARENQPLQAPSLMERMDGYITRGEISDPQHLLPFLTQLSTEERLPLMARNRAAKIVKQISKSSK